MERNADTSETKTTSEYRTRFERDEEEIEHLKNVIGLAGRHVDSLTELDARFEEPFDGDVLDTADGTDSLDDVLRQYDVSAREISDGFSALWREVPEPTVESVSRAGSVGAALGEADGELSAYFGGTARLFEAVVTELVEDVLEAHETSQDGADEATRETVETVSDQVVALQRLLALSHEITVEAYDGTRNDAAGDHRESHDADVSELEERNVALEDEIETLREQLDQQEMLANQVSAAVEATRDVNFRVNELGQQIDEQTDEQSSDLDEITGEIATLSSTIEEAASMAESAARTSTEATRAADEGLQAGSKAKEKMEEVDQAASQAVSDVDELKEHISEIDEFVEVINDIADETNMLALNASIEAERAGEDGRGFAVVANEVKNLAEESREEASKIESMVDAIQADAVETRESLAETTSEIREGTNEVEEAMANMQRMAERINETSEAIEEVSSAADDQASSAEEISSMMDDIGAKANSISANASDVMSGMEDQLEKLEMIASSVDMMTE